MKTIKNIIFDFGKVLVDFDSAQLIQRICPEKERQEILTRIVEEPDFIDRCDKGEQSMDEIIRDMRHLYPDFAQEFEEYNKRYSEEVTGETEGMRELLSRLKQQGYHLYGLSNWCSKVTEVIQEYHELFSLLEGYVISSEERVIKPDAEIYKRLLRKFNLTSEECLFVDDKPQNIEAARKLGMHGIVFTNAQQLEAAIRRLRHRGVS
ncbi:MAG: HAD family phosphatase [Bacteroidales bacterium]|nr:HAD family phosphatase [Bacteroidales bacterium]